MFQTRSQQMVRSKQQLKRELLMGLPKNTSQGQPPKTISPSNYDRIQSSINNSSYSILDEFSKLPYEADKQLTPEKQILSYFMHTKKSPILNSNSLPFPPPQRQIPLRVEAFAQTWGKDDNPTITCSPFQQNKVETISTIQPLARTPMRAGGQSDKSLISVSKNLSNFRFGDSEEKNNPIQNKILTDSILKDQLKDSSSDFEEQVKQMPASEEDMITKECSGPIIKKITLPKQKSQTKITASTDKKPESYESEEQEQKLNKVLSKKSSIKELIIGKTKTSKNQTEKNPSKWEKATNKKSSSLQKSYIKNPVECQRPERNSDDILDLFPPYESSSSGLEAVMEEDQEIEESIRGKSLKSTKVQEKQQTQEKKEEIQLNKKESMSISDLSLEDVSEIEVQNLSGNKNFVNESSLKKISSEEAVPKVEDHQRSAKRRELERHIINDISQDISELRRRIESDFDWSDNSSKKSKTIIEEKTARKEANKQGSQGKSSNSNSMLDFFEKVNDALDIQEISKDIEDLRDKMVDDSSI